MSKSCYRMSCESGVSLDSPFYKKLMKEGIITCCQDFILQKIAVENDSESISKKESSEGNVNIRILSSLNFKNNGQFKSTTTVCVAQTLLKYYK